MALTSWFHAPFWRQMRVALALALALGAAAGLAAATLEPALSWTARDFTARYWVDRDGTASVADARTAFGSGAGRPADPTEVMPFGSGNAVWYRLELPPVAGPMRAVLRVSFPGTDLVELFRPDGDGGWHSQRSGDSVPVSEWPMRHLEPAFMFTVHPGETEATYLRVRNAQPIRVKWQYQNARGFIESVKLWHLGLGAYGGFIAMVVLVSLFAAGSWRDPIHLYYAVHVVLVALSIMALTGMAGEHLWPRNAWWNDKAPVVVPALGLAWVGLFLRELVAERGARITSWLLLGHVAVCVLLAVAFLAVGRENVFRAPSVFAIPGLILIAGVLVWYSLRRPKVGLWVLAGMALLIAGAVLPMLHNLGLLPVSFLVENGVAVGGALEIPLVLVGLFFRSQERRANRQRLEAMAHTDPLTGLANARVLVRVLDKMLRQARRDPQLGAVLRVHVANLNDIRGEHGREAAEAALMRAAECVAREAREGDLVAREQAHDLVLLLAGHSSQKHVAEAGRNIIARGLKFSPRLPPNVTLTLRVAAACAPLPDGDAQGLLQALARVLLDISNDPQGRALRFLGTPDSSPWQRASPRGKRDDANLAPAAPTEDEAATASPSLPRRSIDTTSTY